MAIQPCSVMKIDFHPKEFLDGTMYLREGATWEDAQDSDPFPVRLEMENGEVINAFAYRGSLGHGWVSEKAVVDCLRGAFDLWLKGMRGELGQSTLGDIRGMLDREHGYDVNWVAGFVAKNQERFEWVMTLAWEAQKEEEEHGDSIHDSRDGH